MADDIAVDSAGNCYVAGSFNTAATFGATALSPKGGYDVFVWKVEGK